MTEESYFMHRRVLIGVVTVLLSFSRAWSAPPQAEITNGVLHLRVYLPDSTTGFYRGTRFDWSGVIADLRYKDHSYYGPWFSKTDSSVRDFIYDGPDIIAGPSSAITGPVEEFNPALGFDEAKAGGTFIKIGVGVLRKPDNEKYGAFRVYELVDGGVRTVNKGENFISFTQEVRDSSSGYGYVYRKTLRLVEGKPEMVIEHTLKNIGTRAIVGSTYNHNFLVLDRESAGPAFTVTLPFKVSIDEAKNKDLARAESNRIVFLKGLTGEDRVYTGVDGFGRNSSDFNIRIENANVKAGMIISGDRPLSKLALWSIRSVLATEPFIDLSINPGKETSWKFKYEYYTF
jgi:hypothetical protein